MGVTVSDIDRAQSGGAPNAVLTGAAIKRQETVRCTPRPVENIVRTHDEPSEARQATERTVPPRLAKLQGVEEQL